MIEIKCDSKDFLNINDLTEFQGDLKHRETKDVEKIIKSIKKHGFCFPFFVWKHDGINHVFDGHGRLLALKFLQSNGEEIPALPVVYISAKNEADAKELLLKLNSQYGQMTEESVLEFLDGIEIDFDDLQLPEGIIDFNIEEENKNDDEEIPEIQNETPAISQRGEVYQLGKHKLMCGDSTSEEDLKLLMGDNMADLIVTDPPYNVNYVGKTKDSLTIKNDKKEDAEFLNFLTSCFKTMFLFLKSGGVFYIWHADLEGYNFRQAVKNSGYVIKQCLVWVKNTMVLGRQDYQWKHEPCLYGWKEGTHYWEGRRDLTTVFDEKKNYKKMSKEELLEELKKIELEYKSTILYEDKPSRSEEHPTMKPVKLFERLIRNSSKEDDIVLDVFGGSGTAMIAAQNLNRRAFLMELDPHYCDVIRKRWGNYAREHGLEAGSGAL